MIKCNNNSTHCQLKKASKRLAPNIHVVSKAKPMLGIDSIANNTPDIINIAYIILSCSFMIIL